MTRSPAFPVGKFQGVVENPQADALVGPIPSPPSKRCAGWRSPASTLKQRRPRSPALEIEDVAGVEAIAGAAAFLAALPADRWAIVTSAPRAGDAAARSGRPAGTAGDDHVGRCRPRQARARSASCSPRRASAFGPINAWCSRIPPPASLPPRPRGGGGGGHRHSCPSAGDGASRRAGLAAALGARVGPEGIAGDHRPALSDPGLARNPFCSAMHILVPRRRPGPVGGR